MIFKKVEPCTKRDGGSKESHRFLDTEQKEHDYFKGYLKIFYE